MGLSVQQNEVLDLYEVLNEAIVQLATARDEPRVRLLVAWNIIAVLPSHGLYAKLDPTFKNKFAGIQTALSRYGGVDFTTQELSHEEVVACIKRILSLHDDYIQAMKSLFQK